MLHDTGKLSITMVVTYVTCYLQLSHQVVGDLCDMLLVFFFKINYLLFTVHVYHACISYYVWSYDQLLVQQIIFNAIGKFSIMFSVTYD